MLLGYGRFCLGISPRANRSDLSTLPKDSMLKKIAFELVFILRKIKVKIYLRPTKGIHDLITDSLRVIEEDYLAIWPSTAAGRERMFILLEKTFIKIDRGEDYIIKDPTFLKEIFQGFKVEFVTEYKVERRNSLNLVYSQRMPLNATPVTAPTQISEIEHNLLNTNYNRVKGHIIESNPWYDGLNVNLHFTYLTVPTHGDIGGSNVWVSTDESLYLIDFEECSPVGLYGYDLVCWYLKFENYQKVVELRAHFIAINMAHHWALMSEKLAKSNYFLFNRLNEKGLTYHSYSL